MLKVFIEGQKITDAFLNCYHFIFHASKLFLSRRGYTKITNEIEPVTISRERFFSRQFAIGTRPRVHEVPAFDLCVFLPLFSSSMCNIVSSTYYELNFPVSDGHLSLNFETIRCFSRLSILESLRISIRNLIIYL